MCTNFTPTKRAPWVKEKLGVDLPSGFPEESYPGFAAPIVVKSHQTSRVAYGLARFGLIPSWAKDDKISRHTYNARSETVAEILPSGAAWDGGVTGIIQENARRGQPIRPDAGLRLRAEYAIAQRLLFVFS